jgi:hypothetical protein
MTDKKTTAETAATALTGAELVRIVQGGVNKQASVALFNNAMSGFSTPIEHTGDILPTVMRTIIVPAGSLGANGLLEVHYSFVTSIVAMSSYFRIYANGLPLVSDGYSSSTYRLSQKITLLASAGLTLRNIDDIDGNVSPQPMPIDPTGAITITAEIENEDPANTITLYNIYVKWIHG